MKLTNDLVVLDLETTGPWVEMDRIIEIAMVKRTVQGEEKVFDQRVNPEMPIPQVVQELTGISNEDVKNAPRFVEIAKNILEFLEGADLAGFNVERFDLPLLAREMNTAGLQFNWRERRVYDAQKVFHINEKRDLSAAYKFYCSKELDNAHSALADTRATLDVLSSQVQKYGEGSDELEVLAQYNYKQHSEFYDDERKFRWWNGKLYMMFGKYAKKYSLQEVVQKDRGYLEWILSANFSQEIKTLVEEALQGKFPKYISSDEEE
ncbi:MAG: 3'-5' exonuclease [Candidatus Omnitrophica bacterium]|nr:3'-5' exonuclease [Candidatus Omnitrophota bacterium]